MRRQALATIPTASCFGGFSFISFNAYFENMFKLKSTFSIYFLFFRVTCAALTKIKHKLERNPAFSPALQQHVFYHWNHQGIFITVPTFMPASRPGMLNVHNFMGLMRELNFACCSFCTMRSIKALFQPRLAYEDMVSIFWS